MNLIYFYSRMCENAVIWFFLGKSSTKTLTSCSVKRMSVYRSCKSQKSMLVCSHIQNLSAKLQKYMIISDSTHVHIISFPDFWVCLFDQAVHETGL